MEGIVLDELKIYRGQDLKISNGIQIHQCTLDEICAYGERAYWNMIFTLTSVGADMKFQLYDAGIDYTKISDYELFWKMFSKAFTQKQTCILFGNLDFSQLTVNIKSDGSVIMEDKKNNIQFDEYTYLVVVETLRKIHGLKRNNQTPANERTKQILIDDARDEFLKNQGKEYHSQLRNMISTMVNIEGFKYNHDEVWNMKIGAFIDSVKRITKIKSANLLLQSGYSGFGVSLKDIPKNKIDWQGEL